MIVESIDSEPIGYALGIQITYSYPDLPDLAAEITTVGLYDVIE